MFQILIYENLPCPTLIRLEGCYCICYPNRPHNIIHQSSHTECPTPFRFVGVVGAQPSRIPAPTGIVCTWSSLDATLLGLKVERRQGQSKCFQQVSVPKITNSLLTKAALIAQRQDRGRSYYSGLPKNRDCFLVQTFNNPIMIYLSNRSTE